MSEPIDPSSNPSVDASGASRLTDVSDLIEESVVIFGLAWNAEAERIYGWKRGEVLGRRIPSSVSCLPSEPLHSIMAKVTRQICGGANFPGRQSQAPAVVVQAKWSMRRDAGGQAS